MCVCVSVSMNMGAIHRIHMWFACAVRHRRHEQHYHCLLLLLLCMTVECYDNNNTIIMLMIISDDDDDYDIHNVWLQFTIYTSLGGDNFKWNVSTVLSALLPCICICASHRYIYATVAMRIYSLAMNWEKLSANFLIGKWEKKAKEREVPKPAFDKSHEFTSS